MPEISRFYGIVIKMYFDDHNPPHFHADYGSDEAVVDIHNLAIIAGELPPRALGLVAEWASLHQGELRACWQRARNLEPPRQNRAASLSDPLGRAMTKPKMSYFSQEDVLHLVISDDEQANSIELSLNITAELNEKGELIGIEILHATSFVRDSAREGV